jgi:hypothetical protein
MAESFFDGRLLGDCTYDEMPERVNNPVASKVSRLAMITAIEREIGVSPAKLTQLTVRNRGSQAVMLA